MAETFWRNNTATEVAQVKTFLIDTVGTSDTWTFTVTLEDGSTYTGVTYTEDGTPSVGEVAAGLQAAWAADTNPFVEQITATVDTATVTLTGTSGVPFNVTLASSGTGTDTETTTTAVVSNTNYGGAANWSLDAAPVATNDVRIGGSGGSSKAILYGLDQSSVAIDELRILDDYNANIGKFLFGFPYYLQVDPDSFEYYAQSSLALIDIGSAAISPYIEVNGSPQSGRKALYLKGSAIATLEIVKGVVGVAAIPGETATVTTILCAFRDNVASDVDLEIGSGVTLTTLHQTGGKCQLNCAATTVNVHEGCTLITEGSGAITTLNVYAGGKAYLNSTGTITNLNLWGLADFSGDKNAKTVSNFNIKEDSAEFILNSSVTRTATSEPSPGDYRYRNVG